MTQNNRTIVQSQFFHGIRYVQDKIAESLQLEQELLADQLKRLNDSKTNYDMNISYERNEDLPERKVSILYDRILDSIIDSAQKIKELQSNLRNLCRIRLGILDDVDFRANKEEKIIQSQILAWEKE